MHTRAAPPRRPDPADPVVAAMLRRSAFPPVDRLEVAVSGGADSTALLALAVASGRSVTAHHVEHGVRPGGESEAAVVRDLCGAWGASFVHHSARVTPGPGLEERCRDARLAAMGPEVLTGHTAEDQAETVLLRLLRGTGPAGAAAMDVRRHPLLGLRRADTEALCVHLGVRPLEDPTNRDPSVTRNRVRHEVLPLLRDVAGRDVVPLLTRFADAAAAQHAAVAELASGVDPTDSAALADAPESVATEALRAWWRSVTGLLPPDSRAVGRMMDVVHHRSRSCDVVEGWRLVRSGGRLRLDPPAGARRAGR